MIYRIDFTDEHGPLEISLTVFFMLMLFLYTYIFAKSFIKLKNLKKEVEVENTFLGVTAATSCRRRSPFRSSKTRGGRITFRAWYNFSSVHPVMGRLCLL